MDQIPAINDRNDKAAALAQADKKLKAANKTKKTLKMEVRLVTDSQARRTYESRISRLGDDLNNLKADLAALKQDISRESILGKGGDDDFSPTEEDGQKAGDQMLGEARRLQDKTQESLDYTKQLVEETKEVGLSSLEELKRQRETLNRIDAEADRIDSALDVADKMVKAFGKRMASDKFIQCFSLLNVLLLVGVIAYIFLSGKSLGGNTSSPESPVQTAAPTQPPQRMLRGSLWREVFSPLPPIRWEDAKIIQN
jgi:Snare region anchored in the vesicle membrane C-terminus